MSIHFLSDHTPFLNPVSSKVEMYDRAVIATFKDIITPIQVQTFKHRRMNNWKSMGSI